MATGTQTKTKIEYEVFRSEDSVDDDRYHVAAIDEQSEGEIYVASFSGPDARSRAEEYARFKNGLEA